MVAKKEIEGKFFKKAVERQSLVLTGEQKKPQTWKSLPVLAD